MSHEHEIETDVSVGVENNGSGSGVTPTFSNFYGLSQFIQQMRTAPMVGAALTLGATAIAVGVGGAANFLATGDAMPGVRLGWNVGFNGTSGAIFGGAFGYGLGEVTKSTFRFAANTVLRRGLQGGASLAITVKNLIKKPKDTAVTKSKVRSSAAWKLSYYSTALALAGAVTFGVQFYRNGNPLISGVRDLVTATDNAVRPTINHLFSTPALRN